MPARITGTRLALAAAAWLVLAWSASAGAAGGPGAGGLSAEEKRGKQIYLKGDGGERGEIRVVIVGGGLELPAGGFPCAGCHGPAGEGATEGGLEAPPLDWAALAAARTSPRTGRRRGPYDEAGLARAIGAGLDPSGGRLDPGMPSYRMTPGQMADLVAYLRVLGQEADVDPGVSETAIRVGAALPMTGALSRIGEDVEGALSAYFAEVNAQGGIYGRRFELVVEDSRGEPAETAEATRRLVERDGVFALVGSFEPRGSGAADEVVGRAEVPLVGPVALSPRASVPRNRYVFYLLPSFGDQARVLVDFVALRTARPGGGAGARLAVVYADSEFDADSLAGLRSQAAMHSMAVVAEHGYASGRFSAARAADAVARGGAGHVFFFGGPGDLNAFAREMERARLDATLLSSVLMAGRGAFTLPPGVSGRTYLAYPSVPPERGAPAEFVAVMRKAGAAPRSYAFQSVAYAAAKVLVEATRHCGRRLSRAALVGALEQLRGFETGVVPPVTFDPNRRVGAVGSYVVGVDPRERRYVPLTDWLVPKERP